MAVRLLSVDQALNRLESALAEARPASIRRDSSGLRFRGGPFRLVSNWNILLPISTGVLEVSPREDGVNVRYRVTFTEMLVIVTLMVGGIFGPVVVRSAKLPMQGRLGILLFAWSWLFGANFALTWWRLPRFLVRTLSHSR